MMAAVTETAIAKQLVCEALKARERAYAPYSHYAVGAAVLTDSGKIYSGCNVENASYGATICAERCAVTKAVSEGALRITAIAIVGGDAGIQGELPEEAPPCGICRQVIREFSDPAECTVILAKSQENYREVLLEELLPLSFGPDHVLQVQT